MLKLFWQILIENCDDKWPWTVTVVTQIYTLYPNQFPQDLPIKEHEEFNVTLTDLRCHQNSLLLEKNVTLSILINDNIVENVPYVLCKISKWDSSGISTVYLSRSVYLQTCETVTTQDHDLSPETSMYVFSNDNPQLISSTSNSEFNDSMTLCSAALSPCQNKALLLCVLICLITYLLLN